jgi:hypothetical protein
MNEEQKNLAKVASVIVGLAIATFIAIQLGVMPTPM